jgi:hypothetical protein
MPPPFTPINKPGKSRFLGVKLLRQNNVYHQIDPVGIVTSRMAKAAAKKQARALPATPAIVQKAEAEINANPRRVVVVEACTRCKRNLAVCVIDPDRDPDKDDEEIEVAGSKRRRVRSDAKRKCGRCTNAGDKCDCKCFS